MKWYCGILSVLLGTIFLTAYSYSPVRSLHPDQLHHFVGGSADCPEELSFDGLQHRCQDSGFTCESYHVGAYNFDCGEPEESFLRCANWNTKEKHCKFAGTYLKYQGLFIGCVNNPGGTDCGAELQGECFDPGSAFPTGVQCEDVCDCEYAVLV